MLLTPGDFVRRDVPVLVPRVQAIEIEFTRCTDEWHSTVAASLRPLKQLHLHLRVCTDQTEMFFRRLTAVGQQLGEHRQLSGLDVGHG